MVDVPQDTPTPTEVSAGRLLQAARERMGLSVQEAADGLNLRPAIIEALEADRYEMLPPRTFVKGYLRAYAKLIGLKEYDVLAAYEQQQPGPAAEAVPVTASSSAPRRRGGLGGLKWLVALVAVLLLSYVGYTAYLSRTPPAENEPSASVPAEEPQLDEAEQTEAEAETAPEQTLAAAELPDESEDASLESEPLEAVSSPVEAASVVLPPPVTDSLLVLEVSGESWIEIEDAAGRRPVATLVQGPQTVQVDGSAPFRLVIGNAEAVQVRYAGEPVPLERHTRRTGVARLTVPLSR